MKFYGFDTETPGGELGLIASDQEAAEVNSFEDVAFFLTKKRSEKYINE